MTITSAFGPADYGQMASLISDGAAVKKQPGSAYEADQHRPGVQHVMPGLAPVPWCR